MAFLTAFLASLGLAFLFRGSEQRPRRAGGWAVLGGILLAIFLFEGMPVLFTLRIFWLSAALLFFMGVADDLLVLSPPVKFVSQLVASALFIGLMPAGIWGGELETILGWGAFLVWGLWLVGITNAVNLLDNADGLTPATGLAAALGFLWLGYGADWVLLPLAGALAGFLVLNAHRARIHLGDAGSHLVGFSLAALPLFGLPLDRIWVPVLVLIVPIADTAFVTVTRILRGASPFQGGKDHLSHRLMRRGWPAWVVWAASACVTGLAVAAAALFRGA